MPTELSTLMNGLLLAAAQAVSGPASAPSSAPAFMAGGAGLLLRNLVYLAAAAGFITGLKMLSSPRSARRGNAIGAVSMLAAVLVTATDPRIFGGTALGWGTILLGLITGGVIGALFALRVHMRGMPQMVALLNGFGGLAAALVGFAEYLHLPALPLDMRISIAMSIVIGMITFAGSLVAFAKLEELKYKIFGQSLSGSVRVPGAAILVFATPALIFLLAVIFAIYGNWVAVLLLLVAAIYGFQFVLPIGGADMPVVIALLNSLSGLGAAATGMVLYNDALIIAGALVGASGFILTMEMCKAMNRSLLNVIAGGFGTSGGAAAAAGASGGPAKTYRQMDAEEAAMVLEAANQVIIVPGYGMAVAQAQHAVAEMASMLEKKGVTVKYGVHPVAGRMPGHMNVLLADANVPYEQLHDLDLNSEMEQTDAVLVIGANDVVNPAARTDKTSPIYGMPIFNVDKARTVMVLKRGMSSGYAGVDNELFYLPNTVMVFGDAKATVNAINAALKGG
jgi:NAD(P) transhydrogenase subunit beta